MKLITVFIFLTVLIFLFSLTIISCSEDKEESTTDTVSTTTDTVSTTSQMGGSIQGMELSLSTVVTTVAGTGSSGSADNTTGTSASFNRPTGITTDGTNLYVTDTYNYLIRKIVL